MASSSSSSGVVTPVDLEVLVADEPLVEEASALEPFLAARSLRDWESNVGCEQMHGTDYMTCGLLTPGAWLWMLRLAL